MTEPIQYSSLDHYRLVRSQIEHEDNLVSQRLSWMLASQSFLFTAYAITLNGPSQSHFKMFETSSTLLLNLLIVVGIVSALLIWASILAGVAAMAKLRRNFHNTVADDLPAGLPPIQSAGLAYRAGQFGPLLIPLLFTTVWLVLLLHG
jgi:hypothetical protein